MTDVRRLMLAAAMVFAAVIGLYLPTLRGGFVYDSIAQVLYSDYIHTPSHWADVLTLRVVGQDELDRNRPLLLASLMLDAAIWNRDPFGYRLTSVLLHALNAALLFAFIVMVSRRGTAFAEDGHPAPASSMRTVFFAAACGALAFALHPLVVEAVAEPSNREDLLVLLAILAGLLFVAKQTRPQWVPNVFLVLTSFFAVLAKESGVAAPFVFALACWLHGSLRRCLPGLIGGIVAVAGFLAASYAWRPVQSGVFINGPAPLAGGWLSFLAAQARIWTLQLRQVVWPSDLSAQYTPDVLVGISPTLAVAVLVMVAAAAAFLSWKSRLAALGVGIYLLALLPASNFVAQFHPMADRYLYVPLAGVGMIASASYAWLRSKCSSAFAVGALVVAGSVVLLLEYTVNLQRQKIWQTPAALWTDVLRQYPHLAQAHFGMANAYYRAGEFEAALASAQEAVRTSSGRWAEPYAMRAACEWRTGRRKEALASFAVAAKLSRAYVDEASMRAALFLSPEQLAAFREILAAQ
ncbi:MAG: tetratricopeptide repeat protein [Chthoniobacterales bacterium]|nr:tetratricopeptide repeat protein [Chthoniobacterales bacterium]